MDEAVSRVLAEYQPRIAAEEKLMQSIEPSSLRARRDEFLLPIGPDTGQVLNILIKSAKARSILEVGTSYGYSTLWLADAARHTDGRVVSLELADYKAQHAREALRERVSLIGWTFKSAALLKPCRAWRDLSTLC